MQSMYYYVTCLTNFSLPKPPSSIFYSNSCPAYKLFLKRDWFEDELRAFQGGKDGLMPCVWENELSSLPQVLVLSQLILIFFYMLISWFLVF